MSSARTGVMDLRLHHGSAPDWLVSRMVRLASSIFTVIHDEFGSNEILVRLSDPLFFQACSNVLGFDWDSSGSTTVTCRALKNAFEDRDVGVKAAGGKGARSHETFCEIEKIAGRFDISAETVERLVYCSRMTAKVDTAAIQAGYSIYHHVIFVSNDGAWAVVQQGMNLERRSARRYHWLSSRLKSFVCEPHTGIVGDIVHEHVLDMTNAKSEEARRVCVDLVNEKPDRMRRIYESIGSCGQASLTRWIEHDLGHKCIPHFRVLPRRIDWKALGELYNTNPRDFEEVLAAKGVGAATVRGLALVSELIYGQPPSWSDPVRYSFAYGGKDGVPFPVDRGSMDESIQLLSSAIEESRIGNKERLHALQRLRQ